MCRTTTAALALAALVACGPKYPPHGPHHDAVDSPEAATACPVEREAAVTARQALLEPAGPPDDAREVAARAVLRHAACEARGVTDGEVPVGRREVVLAALRALRVRYDAARNLFDEVAGYGVPRLTAAALSGQAELGQAMAALLATMSLPVDVTEAAARAELRGEQADLVSSFAGEAVVSAERVLAIAAPDGAADPTMASDVEAACAILLRLDPKAAARRPACDH